MPCKQLWISLQIGGHMRISWFSAGISSFLATYLERDSIDRIVYIHIDDQHPDTMRFVKDCEALIGKPIEIIQSRYKSVDEVVRAHKYINGVGGARCTFILKKRTRKEWEYQFKGQQLEYVWGMDLSEKNRADRLIESMPDFKHIFPLIDRQITKEDAHAISKYLGLKRPVMYDMGYSNNNCIGCVKGGIGYWNKIRIDFPEVFKKRAELERLIGNSCLSEQIDGKKQKLFLDELDPVRGRIEDEIMEDCNIMCQLQINQMD